MKKLITILIAVTGVLLLLVITRPDEENFKSWVKKKYSTEKVKTDSDNILDKMAEKGFAKATQVQLINSRQYEKHFLSSEIITWANLEKKKYIGILGTWIEVPVKE